MFSIKITCKNVNVMEIRLASLSNIEVIVEYVHKIIEYLRWGSTR